MSTCTAGFLGATERGPTSPAFIANFVDFQKKFGGFVENSYLSYGIEGFFRNGGQRCFVGRIIGKGAGTAQTALTGKEGSDLIGIPAAGPGNWGNAIALKVEDATLYREGKNELFKLAVSYWKRGAQVEGEPYATSPRAGSKNRVCNSGRVTTLLGYAESITAKIL